jgi:hypothetical protein
MCPVLGELKLNLDTKLLQGKGNYFTANVKGQLLTTEIKPYNERKALNK